MGRTSARALIATAVLVAAVVVAPAASAVAPSPPTLGDIVPASSPPVEVVGATSAEREVIAGAWEMVLGAFPRLRDCIEPLAVTVVDRAEDWYGGPVSSPIAAFYRFPPAATIFIEHGKVNEDNLVHEMAHHIDITCGLSEWRFGSDFLGAQGFPVGHSWIRGSGWSGVPAEHFAEAVVEHLGIAEPDIDISPVARTLIAALAREALVVA